MRHRLVAPVLALLAVAVCGVPPADSVASAARSAKHCTPRAGEHVVARSTVAAVLARGKTGLTGCSLSSGRRLKLERRGGAEFVSETAVHLHGSRVVFIQHYADHYGNSSEEIVVDDAIHAHRRTVLDSASSFYAPPHYRALRVADGGAVAWLDLGSGAYALQVWRPGDVVRTVDTGFTLGNVALTRTTLSWSHSGVGRRLPLATPDACPAAGRIGGTPEVDLLKTGAQTAACWRATGAIAAPADPGRIVVAGPWVASWTADADAITARDLATGAVLTIPAPGVELVALDEAGSVLWSRPSHPSTAPQDHGPVPMDIWASDAAGTRSVAQTADRVEAIVRDGTVVRWAMLDRWPRPADAYVLRDR